MHAADHRSKRQRIGRRQTKQHALLREADADASGQSNREADGEQPYRIAGDDADHVGGAGAKRRARAELRGVRCATAYDTTPNSLVLASTSARTRKAGQQSRMLKVGAAPASNIPANVESGGGPHIEHPPQC